MNKSVLLFVAVAFVAVGLSTSVLAETRCEKPMGVVLENKSNVGAVTEYKVDFTVDLSEGRLAGVAGREDKVRNHMCNFIPEACDHAVDIPNSGRI